MVHLCDLHIHVHTSFMCYAVLSCFSCVELFATLWTVACQGPLYMGFPRQEYWSGLPGDLPDTVSLASPALAGKFFTSLPPGKPPYEL